MAPVPMFIKYPGQTTGKRDLRNAQTIDVFPTIVDVLGGELAEPVDGISLLAPESEAPATKRGDSNRGFSYEVELDEYVAALADARQWFGEQLAKLETPNGLIAPGPRQELVGRSIESLNVVEETGRVEYPWPGLYEWFDSDQRVYPLVVRGEVTADELPEAFAIVVDGVVWTTVAPYRVSGHVASVGAFVPMEAFKPGPIVVEILGIREGNTVTLVRYS